MAMPCRGAGHDSEGWAGLTAIDAQAEIRTSNASTERNARVCTDRDVDMPITSCARSGYASLKAQRSVLLVPARKESHLSHPAERGHRPSAVWLHLSH